MINVDGIIQKINSIKSITKSKICAVVKADAYGTGLTGVVKKIKKSVDYFAVAKVGELAKIRQCGIYKPTIILSPLLNNEIEKAIKLGGEISIDSLERLKETHNVALRLNKIAKIHIQIDTGMRRFGVQSIKEYYKMLDFIKDGTHVTLVGVYSHFYSEDLQTQASQREIFERIIIETHRKRFYPIFHISASSGSWNKQNAFDLVRLGICLYEQNTELLSNVIAIKNLKTGEGLGYDHEFVAKKDTLVGVVGIGYGDGIHRVLAKGGYVEINGTKLKIIGKICMDCFFVDLENNKAIRIGDDVKLFGNCLINICEVAKQCDTITYEILTSIKGRVKKEYIHANNNRSLSR